MDFARTPREIDVTEQDSTSPLFQYFLMNEIKDDITLTALAEIDDTVISVSAGHGFIAAAGEFMTMWCGNVYQQVEVESVATNNITIAAPLDNEFTVTDTKVIRGNILMNVDGSSSSVDFKFTMGPDALIPIDISFVIITMQHGANVPDDGKFGGLSALGNGLFYRHVNGARVNLGIYKTNQDFKDRGASVEYTDKAPAGTNGTNIDFSIKEVFGQVIRINPRLADYVLGQVRDNINVVAGMAKMTTSLIGSFTSGE